MKNIVAIKGQFEEDVVTQHDLQELGDAQSVAWAAERAAQRKAARIEARISAGARTEVGPWTFDRERGMARTKKDARSEGPKPPKSESATS